MRQRIRVALVVVLVVAVLGVWGAQRVAADDLEQRLAAFWARINALAETDFVSSGDLGQWALFVIEREPRARLTVGDFRGVTAQMQGAMDRAGLAAAAPTPTPTAKPTPTPSPTPFVGEVFDMNTVEYEIRRDWEEQNDDRIDTLECETKNAVAPPATIKCGFMTDQWGGTGYIRVRLNADADRTYTWVEVSGGYWMEGILRWIRIQYDDDGPDLISLSCTLTGFVDAGTTKTDTCSYVDEDGTAGDIQLTLKRGSWTWVAP